MLKFIFYKKGSFQIGHRQRRGKISFLLAISHDSKVVEYLDLTNIEGGFKILTELPLRYGLNGAAIASYNESLVRQK